MITLATATLTMFIVCFILMYMQRQDYKTLEKDFITVAKWTATIQAQAKTNAENILQVDKNRLLLYGRVIQLEDDAHEFNEMFTVLRTGSYN